MPAQKKWTEEEKARAIAIAQASSQVEASRQTGIPAGTIARWMATQKRSERSEESEANEAKRLPKKIEAIAEEAIEQAKEDVREYVADRVKEVADGLLKMVETAQKEAMNLIETGLDPNDSKSQWLKAVIGAIAQGTEKHQLLMGKPTSRQEVSGEVTTKHEQHYHIIQELVNRDDEVADRILAAFRQQGDIQSRS